MGFVGASLGWLYGVLAIASVFITVGMGRLWHDRIKEPNRPYPDAYHAVLTFAGLHGLGGAIYWTIRCWDAVVNGIANTGSGVLFTALATILYAAGKIGLVHVSAMNSKPTVWRIFVAMTVAWSASLWWAALG
jgi:hypothetical protein